MTLGDVTHMLLRITLLFYFFFPQLSQVAYLKLFFDCFFFFTPTVEPR